MKSNPYLPLTHKPALVGLGIFDPGHFDDLAVLHMEAVCWHPTPQ